LGDSYPVDPKLKKLLQAIDKTYRVSETDHVLHHKALNGTLLSGDQSGIETSVLFKAMLDDQTEFVCRFLPNGILTYVNEAYCRYFGKKRQELIGTSFMPVIPAEELAEISKLYLQFSPGNPIIRSEHRVIMPDNSTRWHQWTDKAFFDGQGKLIEIMGIGRDITEQKKAEFELKESEERYRTLFEAAFEGIVVHIDGIILEVNRPGLQMMQYTAEEILGRSLFEFVPPSLHELIISQASTKPGEPYEATILRKDGSPIFIEVLSKKHIYKGREVRVAAFRDISQRKAYEKEIQAQKILLSSILNTLPINVYIKDMNGCFVFINESISQSLGRKPIEVLGKTDFDIVDFDTASRWAAEDRHVWKSNILTVKEEKVVQNGKTAHLLSGKTIIHTEDMETPLLLGYSLDITDRANAEEELRAQESFIRQVLDTGPNLVFVKDADGNFMLSNQATADLFGMSKTELTQQNNYKIHSYQSENENYNKVDQQVIEEGITVRLEEPFTRPDGETLWFYTIKKPLYLQDGSVRVLGVSQDITEQKRMLELLKTSEMKYRRLVECATDMIHNCDEKGYFVYVNPVTCHVLGYAEEELIGKHYSEFVTPDYVPVLEAFYKQQMEERIADTYIEFKGITRTGEVKWVGQNVHMFMEGKQVKGFQTVARDITERKKVEEELIYAKQEAERSMRAKEQFLSVMSHEIRTPLNAVIGLTHLLLEENPLPEQVEQLNAIKFSADNLMFIINDILDFSKIESGKIIFENIDFSLPEIYKGIYQSLNFKAAEKNIRLQFHFDENMPARLMGDPIRLNQILLNLVSNAVKFTDNGYVKVTAKICSQTKDKLTLEFKVTDTGIGISEDNIATIFESFTQASSETTRKFGGTGLGLTITKRLVELQGGKIFVRSKIGMGSEFTFRLAFGISNRQADQDKKTSDRKPAENLEDLHILLVEDNKMNQLVAGKFLKRWGATIDVAENGMEAINMLEEKEYHLVLMDLQMPHMDGYAASRFIRSNMPHLKNIPILALTASALLDIRRNVLDAGMNDYITKPFDPQELFDKIHQYVFKKPALSKTVKKATEKKTKLINLEYLEEISARDKKFMQEMIRIFIKQTPGFIDALQRACHSDSPEWATIRYMAHKLKATIAMMGISQLQPVIVQLEKYAIQENNIHDIKKLIANIAHIYTIVNTELQARLEMFQQEVS
jgi:PAS domain S-box-containing protein